MIVFFLMLACCPFSSHYICCSFHVPLITFVLNKFVAGVPLVVNSSWENPTGEWRVGCKLVYELFTDDLTSRVKVAIRVVIFFGCWINFIYS